MLLKEETLEKFGYSVESLTRGSNKKVCLKCDYCQVEYESSYKQYNRAHDVIDKEACIKCKFKKRADISMKLYGVANSAQRPEVREKISENCEGFDEKRKATMMEKYGVENPMDSEELKERQRQAVQDKYGVDNVSQVESIQAKKRETSLERYGNEQFLGSEVGREKIRQGMLDKYGVENAFQSEEVKLQIRQTNLANLGVEMPTQCKEVMDKIEQTNIERYGCKSPSQNEEVKKKIVSTNLDRYGFSNAQQSPEVKARARQRAIESGRLKLYNGKALKELAKEFEIPYTTLVYHTRLYGNDMALKMTKQISALEKVIKLWLDEEKINYKMHYRVGGRISDFWLSDSNIIIELDGLYWHSDIHRPNDYHTVKRNTYIEHGYFPLFFREDEVNNKLPIVKSIIMNKLERSIRVFARKCTIVEVSSADSALFFETNHLMGKGSGISYGLKYGDEIVSCIVVRNTRENNYEISRICHKLGYQVMGGYSKLVTHFLRQHDVSLLTTFIDQRYGDGKYLNKLHFELISCYPSFRWTNSRECLHRMRFPGNTGYEHGYAKIWDCGQAHYDLVVKK